MTGHRSVSSEPSSYFEPVQGVEGHSWVVGSSDGTGWVLGSDTGGSVVCVDVGPGRRVVEEWRGGSRYFRGTGVDGTGGRRVGETEETDERVGNRVVNPTGSQGVGVVSRVSDRTSVDYCASTCRSTPGPTRGWTLRVSQGLRPG